MKQKYIIFGIIGLVAVVAGFFALKQTVIQPMLDDRTIAEVVGTQITADQYRVSFKYPSGVEGYALVEPPVATTSQSLKKAYLMFEYNRYLQYQNAQENAPTPPTVSAFVFVLPEEEGDEELGQLELLTQWIKENPQYTSYNHKIDEMQEVDVDGVSGFTYSTEGLYKQDFTVLSYSDYAYVFAVQYESTEDANLTMYQNLIDSVIFY